MTSLKSTSDSQNMRSLKNRGIKRGFSLTEVVLSLFVVSFSILLIIGLLHLSVTSEKFTIGKTVATGLTSSIYSDLVSASAQDSLTLIYRISLESQDNTPQTLFFSEDGQPTGEINSSMTKNSVYRATIGLPPSDKNFELAPTTVRILITWPAQTDPNPSEWPTHDSGRVEVLTTLDRTLF
ncbi:MAG: hypothetical protein V4507_14975 [Verrucomicrobiota bacterium]